MNGVIDYIRDNEFKMLVLEEKIDVVNYLDLLTMDEKRVSFTTKTGRVIIRGENLSVKKLLDKEVLIVGQIKTIEMGEWYVS